ncbi:MAG: UMP kinase [Hyphomicrobiales bacterium]|nr:UMP kinase [Hyphomicrobiales bacterium]
MTDPVNAPRFKRPLLKLSGEALMGSSSYGIDPDALRRFAGEISEITKLGVAVSVVVGGGNIYRGLAGAAKGMDRVTGDYMGMLATVMNALALDQALKALEVASRVYSAIPMPTVCAPYQRDEALADLAAGRSVIFAGGTGNPFFTTDTTAALRAAEMGCDVILKATSVDGIYSANPKTDPSAVRYDTLTYTQVLAQNLEVMDGAAIAIARDNRIPVLVFSLLNPGNIVKLFTGETAATVVSGV